MTTSYNNSKKISQLKYRDTLPIHKDHTWIAAAQYNSEHNSYHNIAISLKPILEYPMTYASYLNSYTLNYVNSRIDTIKRDVQIIPVDYDNIYSYVTSYSTTLMSYYVNNLNQNLTKMIKDGIGKTSNNSLVRNQSKKISELKARDEITKHKDHSWFALAQYDSRVNSYHNIAINLNTITSYCTDYSDDQTAYTFKTISYEYKDLKDLQDLAGNISYIGNSYIGGNIISYSFSYTKDYFEWQILP